jgi:acylphosphatase
VIVAEETNPKQGPSETLQRRAALVRGVVQGVGFRPFVYRLAIEEGLTGLIGNDTDGVTIEIEGSPARVAAFLARLRREAPPLARIDSIVVRELPLAGALAERAGFQIVASEVVGRVSTGIPADAATCTDCLRELLDPNGPPLPVSLPELHQLRSALHHYAAHSLRPATDLDGEVQDVPGLPGGVRRSAEPALPCAAQCLLGRAARGSGWSAGWR